MPSSPLGKLVVAAVLGLYIFALRSLAVGVGVFADWSWLGAAVITSTMLLLYYASYTLRAMLPELSLRLSRDGASEARDAVFMTPINTILSDRNFIRAGTAFGISCCVSSVTLGPPCVAAFDCATFYIAVFLGCFLGGMAVWGIYGVTVTLSAFSRAVEGSLDHTAPDGCGGVQFVGKALVVFASVTLIGSVQTSLWILMMPWTRTTSWWVIAIKWFWIVFPFAISLFVLLAPAVPLNKALRHYNVEGETRLRRRLATISAELEGCRLEPGRRHELREDAAHYQNVRKSLYQMGTWPYGVRANMSYLAVFLLNMLATASMVQSVLPSLSPW